MQYWLYVREVVVLGMPQMVTLSQFSELCLAKRLFFIVTAHISRLRGLLGFAKPISPALLDSLDLTFATFRTSSVAESRISGHFVTFQASSVAE